MRSHGVRGGDVVAVVIERSPTAVAAVLHAGATYLPLDPHHPADRIGQIRHLLREEGRDGHVPRIPDTHPIPGTRMGAVGHKQ
ncbi:AMP-binding protein [Streptomyces hundungensis]|uniref:AMP-binding protein n=1 Tax=Streptomyces hundungensis TaxID=1077946 RepID=UPI000EA8813F